MKKRTSRTPHKLTSASLKPVGVPLTVTEKYDKLRKKNPVIDKLRDEFDLGLTL